MLRNHEHLVGRLSMAADSILLAIAVIAANLIPTGASVSLAQSLFVPPEDGLTRLDLVGQLAVIWVAWLVFTNRFGYYLSRRTQSVGAGVSSVLEAFPVSAGVGMVVIFLTWGRLAFDPATMLLLGFIELAILRLGAQSTLQQLRSRGFNFRRYLIIGDGAGAERMLANWTSNRHFGLRPIGTIPFPGHGSGAGSDDPARLDKEFENRIAENEPDCVIVSPPTGASIGEVEAVFRACDLAGIPCKYVPNYLVARNLHMRSEWLGDVPVLYFASQPYAPLKQATKRAIDVLGAASALLFLSPVLILVALAIKLDDRGPILHRQIRVGLHGRRFKILKFRSMHVDAEKMRAQLQHLNEEDGPAFKVRNDPRITRVGRFIRRFSLDELPQFINVLVGDMSLVGPRPPIPSEVREYDWWQRRRIAVRPGLTCIWQVWGRNKVSFGRWMEMDLFYVDHWSLWMDLKLMIRTIGVVLRGTGS